MYYKLLKLKFLILQTLNKLINLKMFFKSRSLRNELSNTKQISLTGELNANGYLFK